MYQPVNVVADYQYNQPKEKIGDCNHDNTASSGNQPLISIHVVLILCTLCGCAGINHGQSNVIKD